ncbi:MAG TPA: ankyrin repeat domain-containing protein [Blastocatellia bacterium]|nr:ankyrin repeat domain-containing protein [Blastocatellia bacterium]
MSARKRLNRELLDAVLMRDIAKARTLLKQGANVNARDNEHDETPLMLAVRFADAAMVELLLNAGAEIDARDDKGRTALFFASALSESFKVILETGADIHAKDNEGNSILLRRVAQAASVDEVEELLRLGIDPSLQNEDGETAFDVAEKLGLVNVVERLKSLKVLCG